MLKVSSSPSYSCFYLSVFLIVFLIFTGCGSANSNINSPFSPSITTQQSNENPGSNRYLWGYWEGLIPDTHDSIDLIPVRDADMHLNVRKFLEETPCSNCIAVQNITVDINSNTLTADIRLTHPFPGLDVYTGFDVRAVVITDGTLEFPVLGITMPHVSTGDFTLINPDGYTRLWNTYEFPPGSADFTILEYSKGKFASPGDFTSNVNPYMEFSMDPRSHFPAGGSITRAFTFNLKPGALKFGYAVDCSWHSPTTVPVTNIATDFPWEANALESFVMVYELEDDLTEDTGDEASLRVHVADWQEYTVPPVEQVEIECPQLWTGLVASNISVFVGPGNPFEYNYWFDLVNETGNEDGTYYAMLKIEDTEPDQYLGDINIRYELLELEVVGGTVPIDGLIAYVGTSPGGPSDPGAPNLFMIDINTMIPEQISPYVGFGFFMGDPRISPDGSHLGIPAATTPFYSRVRIWHPGIGDWFASALDNCDGGFDFHPDGETLLITAGPATFNQHEIYTANYDGSDRTLLKVIPNSSGSSFGIRNPRWSPDGSQILYSLDTSADIPPSSSMFIYDIGLDTITELIPDEDSTDENASWSPVTIGGTYMIAFDSDREPQAPNDRDIYIYNPNAQQIIQQIDAGDGENHPSWSPTGEFLVFAMNDTDEDSELWLYEVSAGILMHVTDNDSYDGSPSWCWGW